VPIITIKAAKIKNGFLKSGTFVSNKKVLRRSLINRSGIYETWIIMGVLKSNFCLKKKKVTHGGEIVSMDRTVIPN
jgi:hypothetical protein